MCVFSLQIYWTRSALTLPRPPHNTCTDSLWHPLRLCHHQPRPLQTRWTAGAFAHCCGHHPAQTPTAVLLLPHLLPTSRNRRLIICFHSLVAVPISNRVAMAAPARASMTMTTTTATTPMTTRHSLAVWSPLPPPPETAHQMQTLVHYHHRHLHCHRRQQYHWPDVRATASAPHCAPPRFARTRAWRR